jgi:hypothetical protein
VPIGYIYFRTAPTGCMTVFRLRSGCENIVATSILPI